MKSKVLTTSHVVFFACLLSLACHGNAAAQASATLSSAQVHISNLSYRLVDLAPDDGIAPGVVFAPKPNDWDHWIDPSWVQPWMPPVGMTGSHSYSTVSGVVDGNFIYGNAPFQLFKPEFTSMTLPGAYGYGNATATFAEDDFGLMQTLDTQYGTRYELTNGTLKTGFSESLTLWTLFELTPNTAIVFEGDLVQNVGVDPTAFLNDPQLRAALTGLRGHTEVSAVLNQYRPGEVTSTVDIDYALDELGQFTSSSKAGTSVSKSWSTQIANTSGDRKWDSMYFGFSARTTAVGAVPEPSTWVLMLTGLGLAASRARRRSEAS